MQEYAPVAVYKHQQRTNASYSGFGGLSVAIFSGSLMQCCSLTSISWHASPELIMGHRYKQVFLHLRSEFSGKNRDLEGWRVRVQFRSRSCSWIATCSLLSAMALRPQSGGRPLRPPWRCLALLPEPWLRSNESNWVTVPAALPRWSQLCRAFAPKLLGYAF